MWCTDLSSGNTSHINHGHEETVFVPSSYIARRFKAYVGQGQTGEDMTNKGNSKNDDLTSLPGVGAATAKKLKAAKLTSIAMVAKASPSKLQKAGLSVAIAGNVLKAAKAANTVKNVATASKDKAKSKAKGVAEKAKNAAKKAAETSKNTTKKASAASKKATQKVMDKSQKVAEKVVEKTKATTSLKTKKDDDRKGETIKVPRSVKDMPWFKKR